MHLPPLRARAGDTAGLTHRFLSKICRLEDLPPKQISRETPARLTAYSWSGKARQLENAERAVVLSGERTMLYPADFPLDGASPRPLAERPYPFVIATGKPETSHSGPMARSRPIASRPEPASEATAAAPVWPSGTNRRFRGL